MVSKKSCVHPEFWVPESIQFDDFRICFNWVGKNPPTVETVCNCGPRSKLTQWECKDRSPSEGSWACEGASRKILNTYIYHKNQPNVGIYIYTHTWILWVTYPNLGERKIIFKSVLGRDMLVPRRVTATPMFGFKQQKFLQSGYLVRSLTWSSKWRYLVFGSFGSKPYLVVSHGSSVHPPSTGTRR